MKKEYIYRALGIMFMIISFYACNNGMSDQEKGLVVGLTLPNGNIDSVHNINIWIFDNNDKLKDNYTFNSSKDLASSILNIEEGEYTVVACTNLNSSFAYSTHVGMSMEDLLIKITNDNISPEHAHFGKTKVNVKDLSIANINLSRILAELQLTIKNVPPEVTEAKVTIRNLITGIYPAIAEYKKEIANVDLGSYTSENGTITFPLKRIMPSIDAVADSKEPESGDVAGIIDSNTRAVLEFTISYNDGTTIVTRAVIPTLQNGGSYHPVIDYSLFKPGVILFISDINDWESDNNINGEILNSNN